jgi:hypothetical protein
MCTTCLKHNPGVKKKREEAVKGKGAKKEAKKKSKK